MYGGKNMDRKTAQIPISFIALAGRGKYIMLVPYFDNIDAATVSNPLPKRVKWGDKGHLDPSNSLDLLQTHQRCTPIPPFGGLFDATSAPTNYFFLNYRLYQVTPLHPFSSSRIFWGEEKEESRYLKIPHIY